MQDYNMDLVEAAAYVRWLRDGIKPEHDYPWYEAAKAIADQAIRAHGDCVSSVRRGQGGKGGINMGPKQCKKP